jgi:hypothetical protein
MLLRSLIAARPGESAMRKLLRDLNDLNPSELGLLDEQGLRRFEALCESWAKMVETEFARRSGLPHRLQAKLRADKTALPARGAISGA